MTNSSDSGNPFRAPRAATPNDFGEDPGRTAAERARARARVFLALLTMVFLGFHTVGYFFGWDESQEDLHNASFFFYPSPLLAIFASVGRDWWTRAAFALTLLLTVSATVAFSILEVEDHPIQFASAALLLLQPHYWLLLFRAPRFDGRAWKIRTAVLFELVKVPILIYIDGDMQPNYAAAATTGFSGLLWLQALWPPGTMRRVKEG